MGASGLTVVLSGMIAGDPHQGGATWAVLQYVLGLQQLGHEVLLIEPVDRSQLKPQGTTLQNSINAQYFAQIVSDFGMQRWASLVEVSSQAAVGVSYSRCLEIAAKADLLLNISGMLTDENILGHIPVRAYLDLDPAFIQCWQAQKIDMRFSGHTHFVTIGLAIGRSDCLVPTCGLSWIR